GSSGGVEPRQRDSKRGSKSLYVVREETPAGKSLDKVTHRGSTEWVAQAAAEQPGILDTLAYTDLTIEKPGLSLPLEARGVHSITSSARASSAASRCRSQPTAVAPLQKARAPEHKRQREVIRDAS